MAFDFDNLEVSEAELPERSRTGKANPLENPLAESFEAFENGNDGGRKVTVPGHAVPEVTSALRRASNILGCGVRVLYVDGKGNPIKDAMTTDGKGKDKKLPAYKVAEGFKNRHVTILFAAKARKQKRATADESDDEIESDESDDE